MAKCDICGKELKNERGVKIHKARVHDKEDEKEEKEKEKKAKKQEEKQKKEKEKKTKEQEKKEGKKVQICPSCGSPRLEYASMDSRSVKTIIGLGAPNKFYCKDCGYEGSVKVQIPASEVEDIRPKDSKTQIEEERERELQKERKVKKPKVLKPISIIIILGFLITAIFIAATTMRGEITPPEHMQTEQAMEEEALNLTEEEEEELLEEPYPEEHPETDPVKRATGVPIMGFLVPLFIIFFLVGLLIYLLWYYGNKLTHL